MLEYMGRLGPMMKLWLSDANSDKCGGHRPQYTYTHIYTYICVYRERDVYIYIHLYMRTCVLHPHVFMDTCAYTWLSCDKMMPFWEVSWWRRCCNLSKNIYIYNILYKHTVYTHVTYTVRTGLYIYIRRPRQMQGGARQGITVQQQQQQQRQHI